MTKHNQTFHIRHFPNGITLVGEEMPHAASAAFSMLLPLGAATDPVSEQGMASLLMEMLNKGAGSFDTQALSDAFEDLGVQRHHVAGIELSVISAAMLPENLEKTLALYSQVLLEPRFPAEELENVRQLALQELDALEDAPSSKVMVELGKNFYPDPFGRCQIGTVAGVNAVTADSLRKHFKTQFVADGVIIGVAGKFNWESVCRIIERDYSAWTGKKTPLKPPVLGKESKNVHLTQKTSQLQIALAYPSTPVEHPDYYVGRVAVSVLSGGMAGRLFIEVREKRGLVYSVSASHSAAHSRGAVYAYAGTTPENGQSCLEVMIAELKKLGEGVSVEELKRAKADLKSRVVMQGEISSARALAIVNDWWNFGRLRPLEEIKESIEKVADADIRRHLIEFPVSPITLVTLGPTGLDLKSGS